MGHQESLMHMKTRQDLFATVPAPRGRRDYLGFGFEGARQWAAGKAYKGLTVPVILTAMKCAPLFKAFYVISAKIVQLVTHHIYRVAVMLQALDDSRYSNMCCVSRNILPFLTLHLLPGNQYGL